MRNFQFKTTAWLSLLTLPASLTLSTFAQASVDDCNPICDEYKQAFVFEKQTANVPTASGDTQPVDVMVNTGQMSEKYRDKTCGAPPGQLNESKTKTSTAFVGGSSASSTADSTASGKGNSGTQDRGVDFNLRTSDAKWNQCFVDLQAKWGQIGPHCAAIDAENRAHAAAVVSVVFYTIAAAACTTACVSEWFPVLAWTKGVCAGTSVLAAGEDLIERLRIEKMNEAEGGAWSILFGGGGAAAGVTNVALAGTSAGTVTSASGEVSSSWGSKVSSCAAAGLMIAASTIKYFNLGKMGDLANEQCSELQTLMGQGTAVDTGGGAGTTGPSGPPAGPGSSGTGTGATGSATGGGSSGGKSGGFFAVSDKAVGDFINPHFAFATSGDIFAPLMTKLPKEQILDAIRQNAGVNPQDLARKLATQSPASVIGGISGMPPEFGQAVSQIEKAVKEGKIKMKDGSSLGGVMSSGKGGAVAAKAAPNPFAAFGMKGPGGAGGAPAEANFEKVKKDLVPEDNGDIWHEGFGGTIFQIVSSKLVKSRELVDQLEWETPLNRALTGLGNKGKTSTSSSGRQPAAGKK